MASKEINDFTVKSAVTATDEYLLQETGGGTTKKTLISTIRDYILGYIVSLTGKTSPVGADTIVINDSAASNVPKKVTLSNIGSLVGEPVGTIKDWDKSFPSCPALPDNYVECNGALIDDSDSVFDGYRSRNLNNASVELSVTWASGVATIAATDVTALLVGQSVSGGAIAAGAYIADITGTTVTLSDTAISATVTTTFTETNGGRYLRGAAASGVGALDQLINHRHNSIDSTDKLAVGGTGRGASVAGRTWGVGSATDEVELTGGPIDYTAFTALNTGAETSVLDMTVVKIMKIK